MNTTRTDMRRTTTLIGRLVVLVAGFACFLCFPWDTPLVAGSVGSLTLGVRVWVIGLALLATAAVWVPTECVGAGVPLTQQTRRRVNTASLPGR